MSKIGELIVEARKDANMTQVELANQIDTPQTSIVRWENGTVIPTDQKLKDIAKVLKLPANYFTLMLNTPSVKEVDQGIEIFKALQSRDQLIVLKLLHFMNNTK
jgi:transcriptional regulator with XRE-family HTH domain